MQNRILRKNFRKPVHYMSADAASKKLQQPEKPEAIVAAAKELGLDVAALDRGPQDAFGPDRSSTAGNIELRGHQLPSSGSAEPLPQLKDLKKSLTGRASLNENGDVSSMRMVGRDQILEIKPQDENGSTDYVFSERIKNNTWSIQTVTFNESNGTITSLMEADEAESSFASRRRIRAEREAKERVENVNLSFGMNRTRESTY